MRRASLLLALLSLLAAGALRAAPGAEARALPRACAGLLAPHSLPAIRALDPRPGAPRIFAVQYRQAAAAVVSYRSFRITIDCLLRRYVLPYRAVGRPNVVVFDEDTGLATLGIGSRGAAARALLADRSGGSCASPCKAVALLSVLSKAYARELRVLKPRYPSLGALTAPFVAATDTIVRGFLGTFSALARRYGLYMIASGDLPAFTQSRSALDVRQFADPDLRPRPASVYVPTSDVVHNQAFIWGPREVRHSGPDVLRNVVASNLKVPLTLIEQELGFTPGPSRGPAAVANLRPFHLPGTQARLGIATSLPAFQYGSPPAGVDPCSDTATYYMRCLDRLGTNVVIQDEANPGAWTGPDGNGIELWQPLSWMGSTYRAVSDPGVHFAYNVTAMMVGNLADLVFDGQSAITQRGGARGSGCHYIGNRAFVAGEDQPMFSGYAGNQRDFLALAPWVVPDGSRAMLRQVGAQLGPASGSPREDQYVETALVADLPLPVDHARAGCAGAGR